MLSKIVRPFVYMPNPLEDHLPELKDVPMAFMYGEYDWVNRDVADRLIDGGKVNGEVFQVSDSAHHLYLEAPEECCACIIKFVFGQEQALAFIEGYVRSKIGQ